MNLILKFLGFGTFGIGIGIFVGINLDYYVWQWGLTLMFLGIIGVFYESIMRSNNAYTESQRKGSE